MIRVTTPFATGTNENVDNRKMNFEESSNLIITKSLELTSVSEKLGKDRITKNTSGDNMTLQDPSRNTLKLKNYLDLPAPAKINLFLHIVEEQTTVTTFFSQFFN